MPLHVEDRIQTFIQAGEDTDHPIFEDVSAAERKRVRQTNYPDKHHRGERGSHHNSYQEKIMRRQAHEFRQRRDAANLRDADYTYDHPSSEPEPNPYTHPWLFDPYEEFPEIMTPVEADEQEVNQLWLDKEEKESHDEAIASDQLIAEGDSELESKPHPFTEADEGYEERPKRSIFGNALKDKREVKNNKTDPDPWGNFDWDRSSFEQIWRQRKKTRDFVQRQGKKKYQDSSGQVMRTNEPNITLKRHAHDRASESLNPSGKHHFPRDNGDGRDKRDEDIKRWDINDLDTGEVYEPSDDDLTHYDTVLDWKEYKSSNDRDNYGLNTEIKPKTEQVHGGSKEQQRLLAQMFGYKVYRGYDINLYLTDELHKSIINHFGQGKEFDPTEAKYLLDKIYQEYGDDLPEKQIRLFYKILGMINPNKLSDEEYQKVFDWLNDKMSASIALKKQVRSAWDEQVSTHFQENKDFAGEDAEHIIADLYTLNLAALTQKNIRSLLHIIHLIDPTAISQQRYQQYIEMNHKLNEIMEKHARAYAKARYFGQKPETGSFRSNERQRVHLIR